MCYYSIHTDDVIAWRDSHEQTFFAVFPQFKLFCCIKQTDFIFVLLYRNRLQKTSLRAKNKKSTFDFVSCRTFLFFARHDVICDLLQY